MEQTLTLSAPAKINLTLDILRRRADGYHDLAMVMQAVSLCDTVTVRTGTLREDITVETDQPELPSGPGNIAWRAAQVFYAATGLANAGTEIYIQKRIPMQAGLAGGSADGAAVLIALKTLLCKGLTNLELEGMAAKVGSDVPFCVRGGTALAEGRGERLTTLPPLPDCHILLCKPKFGIATPALFGRVQVEKLLRHPDFSAMEKALENRGLTAVAAQLCNVFEDVLLQEKQEICSIKHAMLQLGALNACMTGSGPTVFGLFADKRMAQRAETALKENYSQVFLEKPL